MYGISCCTLLGMGTVLLGTVAEVESGAVPGLAGGEFRNKEVVVFTKPDAHTGPGKLVVRLVPIDLGCMVRVPNGINRDEALGCAEAAL